MYNETGGLVNSTVRHMKKQRPTIPVSEWKLAIHRDATRDIQNQEGTPAHGCECEWCLNWKTCFKKLLPKELQEQLLRVGIELENPTDLYQFDINQNNSFIRVVYHAVGKILSGPNQWQNNEMGNMLMYQTIREEPYLSLVVFPQRQSIDASPALKDKKSGDLIRIDFRLNVPPRYVSASKSAKNA